MNLNHRQATALLPEGPMNHIVQTAHDWTTRVARRQAFRKTFLPLLGERDDILSDIGYRRADIQRALKLPLSVDALAYIEEQRNFHEQEDHQTRLKR